MPVAPSAVKSEVKYKAYWERTTRKMLGENKSTTVVVKADSADSSEFGQFKDQDRGSLTITDLDGNLIHSFATTVIVAKTTMKACASGKYDPFPEVKRKNRRKETQ